MTEPIMNRFQRASQIWSILAWAARNRQTMNYKHVEQLIGVPAAGVGKLLEPIQSYCLVNGLPPLTILVVNGETGLPGSGFVGASAEDFGRALLHVFATDWLDHGNPQPERLAAAVEERPSNGQNENAVQ